MHKKPQSACLVTGLWNKLTIAMDNHLVTNHCKVWLYIYKLQILQSAKEFLAVFTVKVIMEEKHIFSFPGKQSNTHNIGKQQEISESYKQGTECSCLFLDEEE